MPLSGPLPTLPVLNAQDSLLPPHNDEAERCVLGCILQTQSAQEATELLGQLRPALFFDLRHRALHAELVAMRMEGHALDLVTVHDWLTGQGKLSDCGGLEYVASLPDAVVGIANWADYLRILNEKHLRRETGMVASQLGQLAGADNLTPAQLKEQIAKLLERTEKMSEATQPRIQVWTIEQLQSYKPDPKTFLVGANMICQGEITVIAGPAGVGKSRLANTLAFALARGTGEWMGYAIRGMARTFVLQSENSVDRLHEESLAVPRDLSPWVRFSGPCLMEFHDPAFRAELRRHWDRWPFQCLIVDNMTDVARADAREDFLQAMGSIRAALPPHPDTPAIVLLAHVRKARGGDQWIPKLGRQLLDELSGSFALGAKARTVFVLQPGSSDTDDDVVVFDCAKANNDKPLPASAWHRKNGAFIPARSFDFDAWLTPDEGRKVVEASMMESIFEQHGPAIEPADVVKLLQKDYGFAQSTAYRATSLHGKFAANLWMTPGRKLAWKKGETTT